MMEDATIRVAMTPGPPFNKAAKQTARNAPDVPMIRMCPEPTCLIRMAYRAVVATLTMSATKTAHEI